MKYLASRFEKGKQWTEQFMTSKHRYSCLNGGLRDAHATLMSFDNFDNEEGAPRNPNPCLGLMLGILAHILGGKLLIFFTHQKEYINNESTEETEIEEVLHQSANFMWGFHQVLHHEGIFFSLWTSVFGHHVALVAEQLNSHVVCEL